jgi:tetratricopeptide (TPR) repeat protein
LSDFLNDMRFVLTRFCNYDVQLTNPLDQKRRPQKMHLSPLLQMAQERLQAGHWPQSERLCRQVLQDDPGNPDAWLFLGLTPQARGQPDEAVRCLQNAFRASPHSADVHFRLAGALEAQGLRDEALSHYRQAVQLQPDFAEALTRLGVVLGEGGQLEEGIGHLSRAIQARPDFSPAHHNLGVAQAQAGRLGEAVQSFRRAVQLRADYVEAWHNLGRALSNQGQRDDALAAYRQTLSLRPDLGPAYLDLGKALVEARQPAEAVVLLQQAVRLLPQSADAQNQLGLALVDLGRLADAEACYQQALQLDPRHIAAHANLGSALKAQGRLQEGLASYQIALWLQPDDPSVRWNRSLAYLQMGDYERGWPEYEWRWHRNKSPRRQFSQPRWDGSPLDGRTLLVYMEQGLGDSIQFIRYVALLKQAGGEVVVECPGLLFSLFASSPGIDHVVPEGTPLPAFDCHVPLLSLPGLFRTTLATIPAGMPYLAAEEARVQKWREQIKLAPGFRIGICWQGNPYHPWDRHRSVPLRCFAPLAALPSVQFVSLQKVFGLDQVKPLRHRFQVAELGGDWDPAGGEFADTAAVMKNLDLVVTVDTAVAHLAGAVGVPVWLALSTLVDWRWLLDREDSPWYPSMRLYRQKHQGDWDPVFERMAADLKAKLAPK